MIQRKQSIWLLIAALLNAGTFLLGFYKFHTLESGVDTVHELRVNTNFPMVIIATVMTLVPLVTIFMYANRKRQLRMCIASMLAISSFVTLMLNRVTREGMDAVKIVPPPTDGSYLIGAVLPVAALVFIIMAMIGIRRDDKLVKSVDRLR
jgi:surface polysaccharide O-acyltransferase-like enzyme